MSNFGGRGPVKTVELPAQHDHQNPASELIKTTHFSGFIRQSDRGNIWTQLTKISPSVNVGQKQVWYYHRLHSLSVNVGQK